ncbi:uncharacterized protein CDAR_448181 [Caerostris darwini]|uniref:Uncharacterized protein n=1 Tax=Caerostris darwini TaxID=1538125 RepID=A0AAV4SFD8_9ARAC|nr:uncharacterized protein CDAR_448181 [Caerostris darwini]
MFRFSALTLFVLTSCVLIEAQFRPRPIMPRPGFVQPLIPSLDDIKLCSNIANGRDLQLVYKLPLQTCKPYCRFDNETTQITSMDGQLCCDLVGVGPTGICKKGTCLVGGIAGMGSNGFESIFE